MELYHYAWLELHIDRDENWLQEKLDDGFHIHHLDGNHKNNDPSNLLLTEQLDHLRLHGLDVIKCLNNNHKHKEAMKKAKAEGKFKGRAPTAMKKTQEVMELYKKGVRPVDIAKMLNIGRASVYRIFSNENALSPSEESKLWDFSNEIFTSTRSCASSTYVS